MTVGRAYSPPLDVRIVNHHNRCRRWHSAGWRDACVNEAVRRHLKLITTALVGVASVAPAHAAASFTLPDPSGVTLFALGIAGVLIGRRIAGRRKD